MCFSPSERAGGTSARTARSRRPSWNGSGTDWTASTATSTTSSSPSQSDSRVSGPALVTAPRFAGADLRALMAAARASGMVSSDGSLLPIVRITILQSTPEHELWPLRRELVDAIEAAGLPLIGTAVELARHGFRDPRVAESLRLQADEALPTDPVDAWRLYAASMEAGGDAAALAGRRAQAAWAAGDIRAAERLVDGLLTATDHPDLTRVMKVAAAIWARKGMLQRGADAYVGLTEAEGCAAAPLAAVCLSALGDVAQSRAILAAAPEVDYPSSSQVAVSLMAEGLLTGLEGAPDRALSSLLQASSLMSESGEIVPLPEAPAVLAAHVALNGGELGIATDVLQSAIDAVQGGPAFRNRLRLTQALVALRVDRPARARALLAATESSQRPLGLRDEVLAHTVRIGLARRTDDLATLVRAWNAARQTVARMPVDLTGLPALAELSIAAARLHESHLVEEPLAAAWKLLERAGQPASWSTNLHWAGIQAAILRNDTRELARHSTALLEAAPTNRVASRLSEAGRIWAAALAGEVDVEAVERAVRDLARCGISVGCGPAGRPRRRTGGRAQGHPAVARTRPGPASGRATGRRSRRVRGGVRERPPRGGRIEPTRAGGGPARAGGEDVRRDRQRDLHLAPHGRAPHRSHPPPPGRDDPLGVAVPAATRARRGGRRPLRPSPSSPPESPSPPNRPRTGSPIGDPRNGDSHRCHVARNATGFFVGPASLSAIELTPR